MHYTLIIYMISFIVLFGNFYVKAYMEKGKQAFYATASEMVCHPIIQDEYENESKKTD